MATETEDAFIAELKRWRDIRGRSQSALAKEVGYDASYISKVEGGGQRPSETFARAADRELQAGGALLHAYRELAKGSLPRQQHTEPASSPHESSVIVLHEDTSLRFDNGEYRATQRRRLYNDSPDPITRYLIRISVDRYPGDPERSNKHYRDNPLTMEEVALHAAVDGEPVGWRIQHDRDAFKELWLLFENEHGNYPLYPGESAWLEYSYTVSEDKWGQWFQRAIRLPTQRLSVRLDFPADLDPKVWGTETTMTAAALPFRTAISQARENGRAVFAWSTDDPPLHARYRLAWTWRARPEETTTTTMTATASDKMRSIGMVQEGDPILEQPARPFTLPAEAEDARRVVAELAAAAERARSVHVFGKGMGVAAPQIGIDRAVAIVHTPEGETLTLLNPTIIEESDEADEQYEGCLSFFDVRGKVPRPLAISVEHQDVDGTTRITMFERGMARLVAHEVDHLHGMLYRERMRPGIEPIPVAEYRGTGHQWQYSSDQ